MILSTKLLRRINPAANVVCCQCSNLATYYDAAVTEGPVGYCGSHALLEDLDPDDVRNSHMLTGVSASRMAVFPQCMDIEELFALSPPMEHGKRASLQMWVSCFAFSRQAQMLQRGDVVARPATHEWIKENLIYGSNPQLDDSYYIEIHRCDDGNGTPLAYIRLKYQQILGSRFLAVVPWETVVKFFGEYP
jgi:hypothetical protein